MRGWHSGARLQDKGKVWDPQNLGKQIKAEIAKGVTKKEAIAEIFSDGL
jgi:hypothetical protein